MEESEVGNTAWGNRLNEECAQLYRTYFSCYPLCTLCNVGDKGMKQYDIGFDEAYRLAVGNAEPLGNETVLIQHAVGRVLAETAVANVNSPSVDASLKDGYAVISEDIAEAAPERPVELKVIDSVAAGGESGVRLTRGKVVRILSGAPLPDGATAVLAEEFTREFKEESGGANKSRSKGKDAPVTVITATNTAEPGRNVQPKGEDVTLGEELASAGTPVTPQIIGSLVAGGLSELPVFRKPRVGLLATGSEILLPGRPPVKGKLYASNIALQQAWLNSEGIETEVLISGDARDEIASAIEELHAACDVVITSGGAWKSDRDLVVKVMEALGWKMYFHRVRMGPGKPLGAGELKGKPVYILPGGPASNEAAFIMVVFPAVLKIAGYRRAPYLSLSGRLEREVRGQSEWTQFIQCEVPQVHPEIILRPKKMKSRLAAMSKTPAVVTIPEGVEALPAGSVVPFLCLDRAFMGWEIGD